jgi:hypothetical protein
MLARQTLMVARLVMRKGRMGRAFCLRYVRTALRRCHLIVVIRINFLLGLGWY